MTNPLTAKRQELAMPEGDIRPGETRTWNAKDKQGNIIKTFTLFRTEREYVYDLCDAYNDARTQDAIARGVEWYVSPNGELKIGFSEASTRTVARQIESRNESERARFVRKQLESERQGNAYQPQGEDA